MSDTSNIMLQDDVLPKIMYDQTQFTPAYFFGEGAVWMSDETYVRSGILSGYAPDPWICYTQHDPEAFWFGAYPEAVLEREAQAGFDTFSDPVFLKRFEGSLADAYSVTARIADEYLTRFHTHEEESIRYAHADVVAFLRNIQRVMVDQMAHYLLTQPQRFYEFEHRIGSAIEREDISLLASHGRYFTYVSTLRHALLSYADAVLNKGTTVANYKQSDPDEYRALMDAVTRFGFLNWGLLGGYVIDAENIDSEIEALCAHPESWQEERQQLDELYEVMEHRKRIRTESRDALIPLADIMGHAAVLRFDLQTLNMALMNYVEQFVQAVRKMHDIDVNAVKAYTFPELLELIGSGTTVTEHMLRERQTGYLHVYTHPQCETLIGKAARERIKDLLVFRQKEITETTELTGTTASWPEKQTTHVRGNAFVLTTAFGITELLKEFRAGDVLVVTQTHPNLVPVMKRAAAVVSDEGGITCHAAIVSRELRKPCIIGTRLGTKTIKTGDCIELDLASGVVRKMTV